MVNDANEVRVAYVICCFVLLYHTKLPLPAAPNLLFYESHLRCMTCRIGSDSDCTECN